MSIFYLCHWSDKKMMVKEHLGNEGFFSASRLELSLCCTRWEKFKCRCHCRLNLCEDWIKGKLICYTRITRNYLVKGSVLRPHLVKVWIPLKGIISHAFCVSILAFDLLHCENILPSASWIYPGGGLWVHCLLFSSCAPLRRVCVQLPLGTVLPRPSHHAIHDISLDSFNASPLTGEPKLVTIIQMWPHKCSRAEGSHCCLQVW